MNKSLYFGVSFASIALIFYSLAFWKNRKSSRINKANCLFQTTGLEFDIAGTIFMIIGSKNIPITVHGMIGYSALLAMILETVLVIKTTMGNKEKTKMMEIYTWFSYFWWITAYVAGGVIAMIEVKG
jgi:hypothetical protein